MVVALLAGAIGLGFRSGASELPFHDDWAYLEIARTYVDEGEIRLIGWNDVSLVGLLPLTKVATTLFGNSIASMRSVSIGAAVLTLAGLWLLYRRYLTTTWSLFGLAMFVVFPGFATLVVSYLTDVPWIASQVWCVLLGVVALRRAKVSWWWLGAALAVGFWGFTVRQQAILAPLAVLVACPFALPRGARRQALAAAALFLLAVAGFLAWRSSLPLAGGAVKVFKPLSAIVEIARGVLLLGLMAVPLVPVLLRRWWRSCSSGDRRRLAGLLVGCTVVSVLATALIVATDRPALLGDSLSRTGAFGQGLVLGVRPDYLPALLWWMLVAAAVLSVSIVAAVSISALLRHGGHLGDAVKQRLATMSSWPADTVLLVAFAVLTSVGVCANAVFTLTIVDRYLMSFAFVAILLVLRWVATYQPRPAVAQIAVVGFFVALTAVMVYDANYYLVARWKAGDLAVAAGIRADEVDAGFEWVGWHYRGVPQDSLPGFCDDGFPSSYYHAAFPELRRSAIVVASPLRERGLELIGTVAVPTWFGAGEASLYVYRVDPTVEGVQNLTPVGEVTCA